MDIKPLANQGIPPSGQIVKGATGEASSAGVPHLPEDLIASSEKTASPLDIRKAAEALMGKAPEETTPLPAEITWSFQAPSSCSAPPVKGPEGNIYIRASQDAIMALDTKGSVLWKAPLEDTFGEAPGIDDRGNVYYTDTSWNTFRVASYDSKGEKRWVYEHKASTGSRIGGMDRMFIDRDSNSIIIPFKNKIHSIDMDSGKGNWTFGQLSEYNDIGYLEKGPDGNFYLACISDGAIHVLDARTGEEKKKIKGPSESHYFLETGMAKDGTFYTIEEFGDKLAGSQSCRGIRALSPDGTGLWFTKGEFVGKPVIGADGTIYLRRKEGRKDYSLNALDPQTGKLKWFMPIKGETQDPVITPEGNILMNVEVPGTPSHKPSGQRKTCNRLLEENPVSRIICVRPDGLTKWVMEPGMWIYTSLSIDDKTGILYAADNGGECLGIDLKRLDNAVEAARKRDSTPDKEPTKIEVQEEFIDIDGIRLPILRS